MRWHYRDAGLLWLFVPAYVVHLAEEWFGGFLDYVALIAGRPLPASAFLLINGTALVLAVGAIRAAVREERHGWIGVAIATVVLVNTVAHAAGAALTRSYAPGVVSAAVLYVPLGSLTMIRAIDQAPREVLTRGIVAGLLVHSLVFVLAYTCARLSG